MSAAHNKNPDVMKELLKRDDIDVNKQGYYLLNLISQFSIVTYKNCQIFGTYFYHARTKWCVWNYLFDYGLFSDSAGRTALMYAAKFTKNPDVLKELLKRSDIDVNKPGYYLLNQISQFSIATCKNG